jgi:hypothetical protein
MRNFAEKSSNLSLCCCVCGLSFTNTQKKRSEDMTAANTAANTATNSERTERLDRNERRNSLAAFLRAIRFRKPARKTVEIDRELAQLHPRARQLGDSADEQGCVRSAN